MNHSAAPFRFALISIFLPFMGFAADDNAAIRSRLQARFPSVQIESIGPASWAGWYEVVTTSEIVYTNADASLLFAGRVLDTQTKEDLTAKRWNAVNAIDISALPLDLAIKSVKGDGSRKLFVFADPDCPYCQDLEKQLQTMTNVTTYTFLYPLENLHPDARNKARKIWCSENREQTWTSWMVNQVELASRECPDEPTAKISVLAKKLKVSSTPTLFFADGRRVDGLIPQDKLEIELYKASR